MLNKLLRLRLLKEPARSLILDGGLLLDGGYPALTFSALAARTGLARPTIYTYFGSKDDLVVALCEAEFPLVAAEIERAVERATTPRDQIAAFVRAQLRVAQQRRYRIVHALASAPLADEARQRIMALHRELVPSAVPLFVRAGHPRPALAAALLQGLINAAVAALDAGEPPRRPRRLRPPLGRLRWGPAGSLGSLLTL